MSASPAAYFALRRNAARALGFCTTCRKVEARPSASKCVACAERQRLLMAKRRAERAGMCTQCTLQPKSADRYVCRKCLAYNREWGRRLRVKRISASRCPSCGKQVAHADIKTCARCAERAAVSQMLRRAMGHG